MLEWVVSTSVANLRVTWVDVTTKPQLKLRNYLSGIQIAIFQFSKISKNHNVIPLVLCLQFLLVPGLNGYILIVVVCIHLYPT